MSGQFRGDLLANTPGGMAPKLTEASGFCLVTLRPVHTAGIRAQLHPREFLRGHCPVKNSVMSGALAAMPGNESTPEAASTRRNVL